MFRVCDAWLEVLSDSRGRRHPVRRRAAGDERGAVEVAVRSPNRHNFLEAAGAAVVSPDKAERPSLRAVLDKHQTRSIPRMTSISPAARPLVVATYNVHACVGVDRRYDPNRVAAVIRELDADIVALQEVAARDRRGTLIDEFTYLAKMTGFQAVPGPNLVDRRGIFGNVVLTRWPVIEVRRVDLSVAGREPRGAIDFDLAVGGRPVRVIATHLGLRLRERRQQVARLLDALAPASASDGDGACVLLGDLNEWRRGGGSLRPLQNRLGPAPALATFPSWCPMLPLDRVFAFASGARAGAVSAVDRQVHRSRTAIMASDHLPLRAAIAWDAPPRPTGHPPSAGLLQQRRGEVDPQERGGDQAAEGRAFANLL
jgi:endonuclease/exonuclease/phosphatase family metal-dependent hydrolase